MVAVAAAAWLAGVPAGAVTRPSERFAADRAALDRLGRIGVVRFDCRTAAVRVDRVWWDAIDWEGRTTIVARVANVCAEVPHAAPMIVRDQRTDRVLDATVPSWFDAPDR